MPKSHDGLYFYHDCTTIRAQKNIDNVCYRHFWGIGCSARLRTNLDYFERIFEKATATIYYSKGNVYPEYQNVFPQGSTIKRKITIKDQHSPGGKWTFNGGQLTCEETFGPLKDYQYTESAPFVDNSFLITFDFNRDDVNYSKVLSNKCKFPIGEPTTAPRWMPS